MEESHHQPTAHVILNIAYQVIIFLLKFVLLCFFETVCFVFLKFYLKFNKTCAITICNDGPNVIVTGASSQSFDSGLVLFSYALSPIYFDSAEVPLTSHTKSKQTTSHICSVAKRSIPEKRYLVVRVEEKETRLNILVYMFLPSDMSFIRYGDGATYFAVGK